MIVTTKAIVISSLKYGEHDLIVKCYTEHGLKTYLLKNILKTKRGKLKIAYFQLLTQLELVATHNNKGNLNYIKEAKVINHYTSINNNIIKQTVVIFLSDVLSKLLKEEESNEQLFSFLESSLIWLDAHENCVNFHLLFLLKMSKHLGFFPSLENTDFVFFDLEQGRFTMKKPHALYLSDKKLILFKQLLGINFDDLHMLRFSSDERQQILEILLQYFELHLPIFSKPKSLTILKSVFV